jgi:hypothetical protein
MRTQNPPPLKACRFDSDLGHHVNIRLGQDQVTAAAESNNLFVLALFLNEYALSPPQLAPAERYSDDLSVYTCEPTCSQQWSRRIGLLVRNKLIC